MKVDSNGKLGDSVPALLGGRILVELESDLNLEIPVFRAVCARRDIDETLT
jgi:hypothetical protein